jgi:hypothetical protein
VEQEREPTAAGASGAGRGKSSTGTAAVPATETAPQPTAHSAQPAATMEEERTADASAAVSDEATAFPPHASDRAALVNRLRTFADNTSDGMIADIEAWAESEFSGDWAAVAAAAEGGNVKAQYFMGLAPHISYEESCGWMQRAINRGHLDAHLYLAMNHEGGVSTLASEKDGVMSLLKLPLASGSAPAQYITGMLHYIFDCDSGAQEDFLDAAR